MLSVAEARARMTAAVKPLAAERVSIDAAHGRVLAAVLDAKRDQPPFAASAMDGYALASGPEPRDFTIVGESAAGRAFPRALASGEAVRIATGAPMPEGADGVLLQEDADVAGARLLAARVDQARHVRPRGGDFKAGDRLLDKGRVLDPIALALAASAGCADLSVVRRPRVAVLAGGDEVVAPGAPLRDDQVYESGAFAVRGLVEAWGGIAQRNLLLTDDETAISAASAGALKRSDLLVIIGGASVGPHDHARPALRKLGLAIVVDGVSVRPGKPIWFGTTPDGPVLGLPGNPASAIVCAALFLHPVLEAMLGRDPNQCVALHQGLLAGALKANGGRESYLRAQADRTGRVRVHDDQDSSLLTVFAASNALVMRAPHAPPVQQGDPISYLPLALR